MVTPSNAARATTLAARLQGLLDVRAKVPGGALSLREIERRTGIPHQRLTDFLAAPERRRASTVARIEAALSSPSMQFESRRERTVRVDAPLFTPSSLRSLSRPDDARGFGFVYESDAYDSGYATTVLSDVYSDNPEDAIGLIPGFDVDRLTSVIWYTG